MRAFRYTIPCTRPAVVAEYDAFGNLLAAAIPAVNFDAVFVPPSTQAGSQIIDGVLRETTVTKPTLYAVGRPAVKSGDPITVNGESGWQVDGMPAAYTHPWTGWEPPLVIELRRSDG